MAGGNPHITTQCITFLISPVLGVLAGVVCCDRAQALVFLLVSVCCDTAQALAFLLVSVCCDTAQALVL